MKNLLYGILFLAAACSKQDAVDSNSKDDAKTKELLVGNWEFYKSEDSKISGVFDYVMFPELQFKSDFSGSKHYNYIFPMPAEEEVKNFSYAIETGAQGINKPLILTLKYNNAVQEYEVSFRENSNILVLSAKNQQTGSIMSDFFNRVK